MIEKDKELRGNDDCVQSLFVFEDKESNVKTQSYIKRNNSTKNKVEYYSNKKELPIIFFYNEIILYVYKIFNKIKVKHNLVDSILNELCFCHKQLFYAKTTIDKMVKYKHLVMVDASVNYLNAMMRIVKKFKLITAKNYTVWSYKISEFDNSLQKWMTACRRS